VNLVDFLEKLQKKPRYVKIQIMWVGVIVCMVLIFAFWIWSLNVLVSQSKKEKSNDEKITQSLEQIRKDVPTLWQSLGAGISNVFDSVKEGIQAGEEPTERPGDNLLEEKLPIEE